MLLAAAALVGIAARTVHASATPLSLFPAPSSLNGPLWLRRGHVHTVLFGLTDVAARFEWFKFHAKILDLNLRSPAVRFKVTDPSLALRVCRLSLPLRQSSHSVAPKAVTAPPLPTSRAGLFGYLFSWP